MLDHYRRGLGKALLVAAMGKCIEIFDTAGGIGLFVDAKDRSAKRYHEQFGFGVREVARRGASLEQVFSELTEGARAPENAAEEPE